MVSMLPPTVLSVFCDSYFCLSITVLTVNIKAYIERIYEPCRSRKAKRIELGLTQTEGSVECRNNAAVMAEH